MARNIYTNLSKKEIQVYNTIKKIEAGTVSQISDESKIKRTTIYNFIDHLVLAGLISERVVNNKRIYSILNDIKIKEFFRTNTDFENFLVFVGKRNLKKVISLILVGNHSKKVDWIIDSKTSTELLGNKFFENYIEESISKKIKVRVIRSPISKGKHKYHDQEAITKLKRVIRLGQKENPFNGTVAIFDNIILMISNEFGVIGYLISDKIIKETFQSIYNIIWKYSKVLGEGY
jgi:sugar-specific transcriptional regulator TrmB